MAGHSKWANIKHRKGAQDAKRGKIFQKIIKEMQVAIKEKGNDPELNPRLKILVEKAKQANMPNDNIKRVLEKGIKDATELSEVTFEGYGTKGVAIMVETLTDNNNRTVSVIKSIFKKSGGNVGTNGSVSYIFETKGQIVIDGKNKDIEELMIIAMELPILDIKDEDNTFVIETEPAKFLEVKSGLEQSGVSEFLKAEVTKIPNMEIELNENQWQKFNKLIEALEDDDDVSNVYHNAS